MEKLTHWHTLWKQLSEIQSQAFEQKEQDPTKTKDHDREKGQEKDQPENLTRW